VVAVSRAEEGTVLYNEGTALTPPRIKVLRFGDHHALYYLLRLRRFALRLEEDYRRGVLSEALSEVLSEVLKQEKS
jgi:hypothetical protein